MPSPVARAAPVASTAAPGYLADPAAMPSTPRVYLWSVARGRRYSAAASAGSSRNTAGAGSVASSPISTTLIRPAASAPARVSSPVFKAPKVTVRSARSTGSFTAPVSASMPLGRSQATTTPEATAEMSLTKVAAGSRRAPVPPIPRIPSIIRSAPAQDDTRWSVDAGVSSSTRPPARSNAASACGWVDSEVRTAVVSTPLPASRAAAKSASPALLPLPARTTAVRP